MADQVPLPKRLDIKKNLMEDLLKRRFFYTPSFSIYGGVAGLYDLGPPLCAIKANMVDYWRKHFVLEENMLEIDTASVTPEEVLKTSGHVEKFSDFMVRDVVTGNCYRADHLLEGAIEKLLEDPKLTEEQRHEMISDKGKADAMTSEELDAALKRYGVTSPDTGNAITAPLPFNLMFKTSIGPTGDVVGYLRPETAQGIFVNFPRLLEQNGGRMPFAAAQVGQAFRNEIAPRAGLLRVREFTLAEIEHFCSPDNKDHPKFDSVRDTAMYFYSREAQDTTHSEVLMTIGEAVDKGMVNNKTLGYFMARVALFLWEVGVSKTGLRFRQHHANEMAHYACDCWDAEILTTHGWVESVGVADRACFDLTVHAARTNERMHYFEKFDEPITQMAMRPKINKGLIGKEFRQAAASINSAIEGLEDAAARAMAASLAADGSADLKVGDATYKISSKMVTFTEKEEKISGKNVTPGVIEPSFGIGRIMYGLLEHAYYHRENDEQRGVLRLSPTIAPVKCSVLPLMNTPEILPLVKQVAAALTEAGLYNKVDDSSQKIGKRYARTDEIGIPYGITVDVQSVTDNAVTLRERDSCEQIRVPMEKVAGLCSSLIRRTMTWEDAMKAYPKMEKEEKDE